MSQIKKTPEEEKKPASEESKKEEEKKDTEDLDFEDLQNRNEKRLKKWKQVGQTGGQ